MDDITIHISGELGSSLLLRRWGSEAVVYDDVTGDTHLLASDAMRIIDLLDAQPRSILELLRSASLVPGMEDSKTVEDLVANLVETGIVTYGPPCT